MSQRINQVVSRPAVLVAAVLTAAAALTLAGFAAGPLARAIAEPARHHAPGTVLLGVDESSARALGPRVPVAEKFASVTATGAAGADRLTAPAAKKRAEGPWRSARVSWYGPGFYGHGMAGGGTLQRDSMVLAHRSLPFGTKVRVKYHGHTVTAVVRDRGPFVAGRTFDLGPGTAKALGFSGVGTISYQIVR